MYRTILVPLDGSPLAERALSHAEALAARGGGQLVLVRAAAVHHFGVANDVEAERAAVAEAERYLAATAERFDECLKVEQAVYYGGAAEGILAEARMRGADLLVMATHGRSGLGRLLYGSVADEVLRHAPVPALLVPPTCARVWDRGRPLRIVLPLDGSGFALEVLGAVRQLARLAGTAGVELALLQVVEPPSASVYTQPMRQFVFDEEQELAEARRYLGGIAETVGTMARGVTVYAAVGTPAEKIAELARTWGAGLVAMATHGRGGLSRLVMGSTATETLRRAEAPLLLVRPAGVRLPIRDAAVPATRRSTGAAAVPLGAALATTASTVPS